MPSGASLLGQALRLIDRVAGRADAAYQSLRDEMTVAYTSPGRREATTTLAYTKNPDYLPGGAIYEEGLFAWEAALLERPEVPRDGRVLLGGAGGGRELKALLGQGYEVCAFEPVAQYCEYCRRQVAREASAQILCASYSDLVDLSRGVAGALASVRRPFDLVWLGWGSFSHVTTQSEQAALLAGIKSVAPDAPVVLSVLLEWRSERRRLRHLLRRLFPYLGGRRAATALEFLPEAGFIYRFSRNELEALFQSTGYRVALFEPEPYAHALLIPTPKRSGGS